MKALKAVLLATAISAAPFAALAAEQHGGGGWSRSGGYGHGGWSHGGWGHGGGGYGYRGRGYCCGSYWAGGFGLGLTLGLAADYPWWYYQDFPGYYYYPYAPYAVAPAPTADGAGPPPEAASAQPQACGQWVWNAQQNRYDWAAGACPAPAAS